MHKEETKTIWYIDGTVESRRLQWVEHTAGMEETRNVYRILVEKLLENAWKTKEMGHKIKMELKVVIYGDGA